MEGREGGREKRREEGGGRQEKNSLHESARLGDKSGRMQRSEFCIIPHYPGHGRKSCWIPIKNCLSDGFNSYHNS